LVSVDLKWQYFYLASRYIIFSVRSVDGEMWRQLVQSCEV